MKELVEKYKELTSNRRRVGLIKLGIWAALFVILIIIYYIPVSSNKSVSKPNKEEKEEKKDTITNYKFNYTINDIKYNGRYYEGSIELIGTDYAYYISDNKILVDKEDAQIPDYKYININNINSLIDNSKLEATTSYTDGKKEYKYINKDNDIETIINYMENEDGTISVHLEYADNKIDIYYYKINNTNISFDSEKYIYELKEVEHEY